MILHCLWALMAHLQIAGLSLSAFGWCHVQ